MPDLHAVLLVAVMALVTALLRFLPFWTFGGKRQTPTVIDYLGKVLPGAIMAMLVIYCYKGANPSAFPFALPELLAGGAVVLLQLWRRNTLLSIVAGTALYMLLLRVVFV